jgi:hypothetical protein
MLHIKYDDDKREREKGREGVSRDLLILKKFNNK